MFARRLRSMLKHAEHAEFLCRAEAIEMTAHLANVTAAPDEDQLQQSGN